jgi:hypothetical protein
VGGRDFSPAGTFLVTATGICDARPGRAGGRPGSRGCRPRHPANRVAGAAARISSTTRGAVTWTSWTRWVLDSSSCTRLTTRMSRRQPPRTLRRDRPAGCVVREHADRSGPGRCRRCVGGMTRGVGHLHAFVIAGGAGAIDSTSLPLTAFRTGGAKQHRRPRRARSSFPARSGSRSIPHPSRGACREAAAFFVHSSAFTLGRARSGFRRNWVNRTKPAGLTAAATRVARPADDGWLLGARRRRPRSRRRSETGQGTSDQVPPAARPAARHMQFLFNALFRLPAESPASARPPRGPPDRSGGRAVVADAVSRPACLSSVVARLERSSGCPAGR